MSEPVRVDRPDDQPPNIPNEAWFALAAALGYERSAVPALQRHTEMARWMDAVAPILYRCWMDAARSALEEARAEVADLQARRKLWRAEYEKLRASYELRLQEFARETARVSRALAACDRSPNSVAHKASPIGEAGLGWLAAQEYIEAAIRADEGGRPAAQDAPLTDTLPGLIELLPDPAPRVWHKGDPEPPADVKLLLVEPGAPGAAYLKRVGETGWWLVQAPDEDTDPEGWHWSCAFLDDDGDVRTLTEVPSGGDPDAG